MNNRPNIISITCHDLGRHVGCYGVSTVQTPNLDRMATAGVRFTNSFCPSPGCSPSRASLYTGRYPHNNGVLGLTHDYFAWDLSAGEKHLVHYLNEAGYRSILVGGQHESRHPGRLGFTDGVEDKWLPCEQVADHAINWLNENKSARNPLYMQVGFFEPHRRFDFGAFGRDLLVDSGSGTYDNKPINAYLKNSFSKNSIAVDGKSQARAKIGDGNRGAIATAEAPQPNRWHTSATFDFAEGVYDAGYEDPAIEVRHERQVISLRGLGLWIVSDRMRGEMTPMPTDETHTYTQTWNFDDSYTTEQVRINEQERRVWSDDPKGTNVAIYNFAGAPLSYRKWYGEVLNDGSHRGWVRGKGPEAKTPAVDVHATWTGHGEQLVVTLIEARKENQSQIKHIESIQSAGVQGFRATLADQRVVTYLAALDEAQLSEHGVTMLGSALLTVSGGENQTRGIALDARNWKAGEQSGPTGNFEFALTKGIPTDIREIRYPDGALPRRHSSRGKKNSSRPTE